jgi:outer membrane protein assembly factor BamB
MEGMAREPAQPLKLFYCYARKDRALRNKLDEHLATLRRTGLVTAWYDGEIVPGTLWEEEIETHLDTADIILLLISPAFIASDYCYGKEMKRALERHDKQEARVVPILLRAVYWAGTPFSRLHVLPSNAQPVTSSRNRDEAFKDVARGIRKVVDDLLSQRSLAPDPPAPTVPSQAPLPGPSPEPQQVPSSQRSISRRVMIRLTGGLAGAALLGVGIAWLAHSQGVQRLPTAGAETTAYARMTEANGVMFGLNAQHTHSNPYERILTPATVPQLKRKWTFQADFSLGNSSPAVMDGVVYIGSRNGKLYAVDAISGHQKWVYQTNGPITSSPAVADGIVYIGSWDFSLYAIDAICGAKRWAYPTGSYVLSSPTVADGVVYIGSFDGKLYAIEALSGTKKWAYPTRSSITSSAAVADGVVYIGSNDFNLYAIEAPTGVGKWTYQTGHNIDYSSPAVVNGVVYVGSQDSNLYAVGATTGSKKWAYKTRSYIDSSPAVADGIVYIGSVKDHTLYAVDAASGTTKWLYQTGGDIESSPTVAGGVVYVTSRDHTLYALDADTGAMKWLYQTGGSTDSSPAVVDGVVYVGSSDQNLYAFALPD